MRIDHLELAKPITSKIGLEAIKFQRLRDVVALIGKNGSGKSRILNLIENEYLHDIKIESLLGKEIIAIPEGLEKSLIKYEELKRNLQDFDYKQYQALLQELEGAQKKFNQQPSSQILNQRIAKLKSEIKELKPFEEKFQIYSKYRLEFESLIKASIPKFYYKINYFEIKQLQSVFDKANEDKNVKTFEQLLENVIETEEYSELGSLYETGLSYLSRLPNQLIDSFIDCFGDTEKFENSIPCKRFNDFFCGFRFI